jgi:hypothetical protein
MSESMDSNAAKATASKLLRISRKIAAVGKIDNIFKLNTGDINSVEVTLLDPKTLRPVGMLHCRIRINILSPNIVVDERKSSETFGKRVASMYETMSTAALTIPRGAAGAASARSRAAMRRTATCFGCFRASNGDVDFGIDQSRPLSPDERTTDAANESDSSTDDENTT